MDRRNFLRTGSLAMLGSLAVPSLAMPASVRGALGGADNQSAVASAMVHFGVTEADLPNIRLEFGRFIKTRHTAADSLAAENRPDPESGWFFF